MNRAGRFNNTKTTFVSTANLISHVTTPLNCNIKWLKICFVFMDVFYQFECKWLMAKSYFWGKLFLWCLLQLDSALSAAGFLQQEHSASWANILDLGLIIDGRNIPERSKLNVRWVGSRLTSKTQVFMRKSGSIMNTSRTVLLWYLASYWIIARITYNGVWMKLQGITSKTVFVCLAAWWFVDAEYDKYLEEPVRRNNNFFLIELR